MDQILKYPGSKWRIADWIVKHLPAHRVYLEPFFGSGAVFFNKNAASIEVINDLDGNVVNLFRVIRDHPQELARAVNLTPWARTEFLETIGKNGVLITTGDPLEDARRFMIRCWMAIGAVTATRSSWSRNVKYIGGMSRAQMWADLPRRMIKAAERLKDAQIECNPAVELVRTYRMPDALIYADPPYVLQTRKKKRMYAVEMKDWEHAELLEALVDHPGPAIISGYECPMYNEKLDGWITKKTVSQAQSGELRTEVLWLNRPAAASMDTLF